jgi:hypothetical protein
MQLRPSYENESGIGAKGFLERSAWDCSIGTKVDKDSHYLYNS